MAISVHRRHPATPKQTQSALFPRAQHNRQVTDGHQDEHAIRTRALCHPLQSLLLPSLIGTHMRIDQRRCPPDSVLRTSPMDDPQRGMFSRKSGKDRKPHLLRIFRLDNRRDNPLLVRAGRITPLASPPPRDGETKGAGVKEHMSRFPPGKNADKNFCLITHIHKTYIRNPGDIIGGS